MRTQITTETKSDTTSQPNNNQSLLQDASCPTSQPLFSLTGATESMSQMKFRRFQILYSGLRLGVPETASVDLTRERLGFFQVC